MKQVVILAGGKGTRLKERLGNLPKPLVDICGTPLLERQILLAKQFGITHVLILVNHAAEMIVQYCASRDNWGLDVTCIDDGTPRGTAGATLAVMEHLADEFLVMYGDTMLNVDLDRFYAFHSKIPDAAATLLLHPNDHPHDSDLVEVDGNDQIVAFHSYPHDPSRDYRNLVNAALYWLRKPAFANWQATPGIFDFAKDLFPAMIERKITLRGYNSPEYIKDIGTPSRLDKVCGDFRSGKIENARLDHEQAMVFLDRDGTINREVDHLSKPDQLQVLDGAAAAIRRLNTSQYRCCIVSNQPVIARGECSFEGMQAIHSRLETQLGRDGAFIDRIYFCPHHPHVGFAGERPELKFDCDCRKPKTGMIDQAIQDFNVSRERSWLVGDTTVDIETARRAGLKSVLVETGYAGLDYRTWAMPDFTVPDLGAAVSFILDQYPALLARCSSLAGAIGNSSMVLIGGQARSGKSTFASILRDALVAHGKRAVVISADRWLKNADARGPGVLGRFDMQGLQSLVNALTDPAQRPSQLTLAGYNKLKRERTESAETVAISGTDIILLEGVVALALRTPQTSKTHRYYIELDEKARKQRMLHEYRLRGSGESEALDLYLNRLSDEFPIIEKFSGAAQKISLSSV